MNLNATLFAQMVVFFILALVVAKLIWPTVVKTLDERALKISEGLAAGERGKADLAALNVRIKQDEEKARAENTQRIADAEKRAQMLADEIKQKAEAQAKQVLAQAEAEAQQQIMRARDALRNEVAALAVKGAEQILRREIDAQAHADLLTRLKTEL